MQRAPRLAPLFAAFICVLGSACTTPYSTELPESEPWIVAVKRCRIPSGEPWYARFASHTWIDMKLGSEEAWQRVEVLSASSGVLVSPISGALARDPIRWGDREVRVQRALHGWEAESAAQQVLAIAPEYDDAYRGGYRPWPGPNSNTFLATLAERIPELAFLFDHNAVGKDYARWLDAGWTSTKTGFQIDTLPVGVAAGMLDGVEVHLLGLHLGISIAPTQLRIPFLPAIGRR